MKTEHERRLTPGNKHMILCQVREKLSEETEVCSWLTAKAASRHSLHNEYGNEASGGCGARVMADGRDGWGRIANIGRTSGSLSMRCQQNSPFDAGDDASSRNERDLGVSSLARFYLLARSLASGRQKHSQQTQHRWIRNFDPTTVY